jgi:GTP-binding protein LepA
VPCAIARNPYGLRAMAQGTEFDAEELGFMSPTMRPVNELTAGEVGYVVTGLKDVSRLRVGDTLTARSQPAAEPLPGYKDVKPMVFAPLASFFTLRVMLLP